jgi:tetratricopeptide (TPR) repeat protein
MTTPEPEYFKTASSEQMTVTSDHRMVYTPAVKDSRRYVGWVTAAAVVAAILLTLLLVSKSNRSSSFSAPVDTPTKPENATEAPSKPFATISDPSQEWMTAYQAVLAAASQSDTALLEPAMSGLIRLKSNRSPLTAQQRASMRAMNLKGLVAIRESRFGDAADSFLAAYQIDSTDSEVAENLGYALYKDGKFEPAIRALLQSLAADPRRAGACQGSCRLSHAANG